MAVQAVAFKKKPSRNFGLVRLAKDKINKIHTLLSLSRASEATTRGFSIKKSTFKKFTKFTEKDLCQNLFYQSCSLMPANLFKKRLWQRFFPVNLTKHLRKLFLENTSGDCFLWMVNICIVYLFVDYSRRVNKLTSQRKLDVAWHSQNIEQE